MSEADTIHVAERAIEWITSNLDLFQLSHATTDEQRLWLLKPLGELLLTLDVLDRSGLQSWASVSKLVSLGVELAWRETGSGQLFLRLLGEYPDWVILSTLYPTLQRFGLPTDALVQQLTRLLSMRGVRAIEYPAWRELDLVYACVKLGVKPLAEPGAVASRTWLAAHPEPWLLSEGAAYSVTHTVFYITDFGAEPNSLSTRSREYLTLWAPSWQQYFDEAVNYDLLGELVMALRCIGVSEDAYPAFPALRLAQEADGLVPSPPGAGRNLVDERCDARRVRFLRNYHTTLVAIMACAMSLRNSTAVR